MWERRGDQICNERWTLSRDSEGPEGPSCPFSAYRDGQRCHRRQMQQSTRLRTSWIVRQPQPSTPRWRQPTADTAGSSTCPRTGRSPHPSRSPPRSWRDLGTSTAASMGCPRWLASQLLERAQDQNDQFKISNIRGRDQLNRHIPID